MLTTTPLDIPLLLDRRLIPMKPRHHGRDKKEYTIHNPKRKRRLEHRARLASVHVQPVDMHRSENPKGHVQRAATGDVAAVRFGDEAEVVYASYKSAHKGEVDEAHEAGVVGGAVVAEEGEDCPGEAEGGDDEEDEDVVGGEHVGSVVAGDEPG